MKVKWAPNAKNQLRHTAKYIRGEFGLKAQREFLQEVHSTNFLLSENPHLGPVEPLLVGAPTVYRSIVVQRLNKIVYYLTGDHIEVVAFWDVRREPKTLVNEVG